MREKEWCEIKQNTINITTVVKRKINISKVQCKRKYLEHMLKNNCFLSLHEHTICFIGVPSGIQFPSSVIQKKFRKRNKRKCWFNFALSLIQLFFLIKKKHNNFTRISWITAFVYIKKKNIYLQSNLTQNFESVQLIYFTFANQKYKYWCLQLNFCVRKNNCRKLPFSLVFNI